MGEWVNDADIEGFWTGHDDSSAACCPDPRAARELGALMSEISEDQYCASWESGLEHSLFAFAYEGVPYGDGPSPKERQGLIELARRCDGWWAWRDDEHRERSGQVFLPMSEWLELYKARARY